MDESHRLTVSRHRGKFVGGVLLAIGLLLAACSCGEAEAGKSAPTPEPPPPRAEDNTGIRDALTALTAAVGKVEHAIDRLRESDTQSPSQCGPPGHDGTQCACCRSVESGAGRAWVSLVAALLTLGLGYLLFIRKALAGHNSWMRRAAQVITLLSSLITLMVPLATGVSAWVDVYFKIWPRPPLAPVESRPPVLVIAPKLAPPSKEPESASQPPLTLVAFFDGEAQCQGSPGRWSNVALPAAVADAVVKAATHAASCARAGGPTPITVSVRGFHSRSVPVNSAACGVSGDEANLQIARQRHDKVVELLKTQVREFDRWFTLAEPQSDAHGQYTDIRPGGEYDPALGFFNRRVEIEFANLAYCEPSSNTMEARTATAPGPSRGADETTRGSAAGGTGTTE